MADTIWDLEEFKPYQDRWVERERELLAREGYYDGSIYKSMAGLLGWLAPRLMNQIKPLYLPLARAVDVDAGIVPGGWALPEDAPDTWQPAIDQLLAWSEWDRLGVLYVHFGAIYGVSGLKVADLRAERRITVTPVNPKCFMLESAGAYDATPTLAIWVEERSTAGEDYEYAEVITPTEIRTFKNGQLAEFDGRPHTYANELKAVPFVEVRHIETGEELGECTFQKSVTLLDELNDEATRLSTIIRKHSEPQWAITGAEAGELTHSGDNAWFLPEGAKVEILVPQIDIEGTLRFIQEIRDQVYGSLPELAFDDLRKKDQIATATLELQLMELVLKIKRVRPNYDAGLVRALRLAGAAASGLGLSDVAVLDDPELKLDAGRPVLPMDPKTQLELQDLRNRVEAGQPGGYA